MVKRHGVMEIPPTASLEAGVTDRNHVRARNPGPPLRAAVWGASGATGAEVLRQCLEDRRIGEIVAFTRRPLKLDERQRARVTEVLVEDFLDVQKHHGDMRNIDVAYWCLGVSQLHEPKKAGYRRVTRDFTVASATVLKQASPDATFHFLSGLGASRIGLSPVMWGRVKGEAEQALIDLGLARLLIYRPTFIHSVVKRERPTRGDITAELLYFRAIPLLTVSTLNIAHAMLHSTFQGDHGATERRAKTLGPWQINRVARAYRQSQAEPKLLTALNEP
jgi:uncharacterized protein YbjT (DUF2867 family)